MLVFGATAPMNGSPINNMISTHVQVQRAARCHGGDIVKAVEG
jgi:hypothetical protein